jgi:hypothetical protein
MPASLISIGCAAAPVARTPSPTYRKAAGCAIGPDGRFHRALDVI